MDGTPEEFERVLRQAFPEGVAAAADGLLLCADGVQLHFALASEPPRQLGLLRLPQLRVRIGIRQGERAAAERLLERVDRATLRGGG